MKKTGKSMLTDVKDKLEDQELSDERAAQVNSVLRIISESIEKLKISLILPKIFEDSKTLRQYLSKTQYEECFENLDVYLKGAKNQKISMEPTENFRLIRIIDMFQENYKMVELLPQYMNALSEDDKNLLESFHLLYTITEAHLKKSAASELSKEKLIHQIYHENELMKRNILDFQKKLRNQRINLRWKIAAKDGVIQKYEESLAYKKWDNNIRIQQEIAKSTRAIRAIHSASLTRQKEMEEELGKLKANYDKVLKSNLNQEKHARDEKSLLKKMKKTGKSMLTDVKDKLEDQELSDERAAQVNSVLRIISESIEKLKISLILPKIFEDSKTLRQYLSKTQYEECFENLDVYLKGAKNQKISMEPTENFRLIRIIDMFQENYKMVELLPQYMNALSEDDKNLLESFHLLYTITEAHLKKSAASELSKEKLIHQIYHENELMKRNILDFQKKLRNQRINLRWKIAAKDGVIQKYEESLAYKKWDNNIRIQQEIAKSTRAIRAIHSASLTRQKEMEEELGKLKANYDKVLKSNLNQEKHARDEKNKLLVQLQILVRKYDSNIGDKIKENMNVQEIYDEQKRQFDEFLVYYQREEQEFETIMNQRAEEERRNHEEKLMLFMLNRAARIIQRFWRKWRKEQKKKTKGKGKGARGGRKR